MMKKCWLTGYIISCLPLISLGQTTDLDNSNTSLSGQAQVFMQLQQLQNQVAQLRGQLEEQQMQIKQMQQENLERYQDIDKRLTSNVSSSTTAPNTSQAIDANTVLSPPTSSSSSASADPEKEKIYYDAAFGLIQKKDYAKAAQAFTAFLNKFPNSQYAGNAQYWLAEVSLIQGETKAAGENFNKVIQLYPKHPKVPDAMYKLGDIQQRLGNKAKAKELYNRVITKYPYSSAATLAKRSLQTLN